MARLIFEAAERPLDAVALTVKPPVVRRIFLSPGRAARDRQWMWTLAFEYHEYRMPTHGYEPTEAAAFVKSWRHEPTD